MKRILICLFALLCAVQGTWATDYVTDVMLIGAGKSINNLKKQYQNEGWTLIDYDLNKGAGGAYVFLLYKTESSTGSSGRPITDFYIKVSGKADHPETLEYNDRTYTLTPGGGNNDFNNGGRDLNRSAGGNFIYLYYTNDAFDDGRAVTSISINGTRAGAVTENDTGHACDLNKGAGGSYIYMHVTYPQVNSYPYLKRSWNAEKKRVDKTVETCTNFTLLDGSNYELYNGWYVVGSNVEYKKCIEIRGDDVNLIVADGMSLNASEAIRIHKDCKLKIYGQRAETGKVYAHANSGAGICIGDVMNMAMHCSKHNQIGPGFTPSYENGRLVSLVKDDGSDNSYFTYDDGTGQR